MIKTNNILITESSSEYELIDSGEGEKLERFGKFVLSRPDPQALWNKNLSSDEWKKADGHFSRDEAKGSWSLKKDMPDRWDIDFGGLRFWIRPGAFKHTGLFPEQSVNWDWLRGIISTNTVENKDFEVLNLFGYTGGATLACAQAGAKVVHIDGSKAAIASARENAEISGLDKKPIRWILDDARAFVKREIKRERKYDGIIMDPPAFGHGPDNELWKIEENFIPLFEDCLKILKDKPSFFLINGYSAGYSATAYENNLLCLVDKFGGKIETGELAIAEARPTRRDLQGETYKVRPRILPAGIFARWSRE